MNSGFLKFEGSTRHIFLISAIIVQFMVVACKDERVAKKYRASNKHQAYLNALIDAGLANTALATDWISASENSLDQTVIIDLPYMEEFYLDPSIADVIGYRIEAFRGQRIEIDIDKLGKDTSQLFIDLFRERVGESRQWYPVASADSMEQRLIFEVREDHPYILRIQPELLRGGRYRITIRSFPGLRFPVPGKDETDIGSYFNDPRDGGRRKHHGVDIFAPRHTSVIAPVDAIVRSVENRGLGGKYIFLFDTKRWIYLYFAHLQEQLVNENQEVSAGDTIGTVGNSGNARNTPPHLHFGIYYRGIGPVNPIRYIAATDTQPAPVTPYQWAPRKMIRVMEEVNWISYTRNQGLRDTVLPKNSLVQVLGATAGHYRVILPGGSQGMVEKARMELDFAGRDMVISAPKVSILEKPLAGSAIMMNIKEMDSVIMLGEFNNHFYIKSPSGIYGWIKTIEQPIAGGT